LEESDDESETGDLCGEGEENRRNFPNGKSKLAIHALNLFQSQRIAASFLEDEIEVAPTLLTHNVALVTDPNLIHGEQGKLYYAVASFYNTQEPPEYALTVNDTIYRRIIEEIATARDVPCGLYFCCHGGDGAAHTGFSHDDFVDIRLAWTAIGCIFVAMFLMALY
jgi:hypothetical protein